MRLEKHADGNVSVYNDSGREQPLEWNYQYNENGIFSGIINYINDDGNCAAEHVVLTEGDWVEEGGRKFFTLGGVKAFGGRKDAPPDPNKDLIARIQKKLEGRVYEQ